MVGLTSFSSTVRADSYRIQPERVLSVVTADWNKDGNFDRAILIEAEPTEVDLLIYLSDGHGKMQLAIAKKNIAWRGAMWGTQPTMNINPVRSLEIISGNDAIGRNRWMQKLTVAYRNREFTVVGYTYNARDTLDLDDQMECDVNLLTGMGIKNGQSFMTSASAVTLANWSETSSPKECH